MGSSPSRTPDHRRAWPLSSGSAGPEKWGVQPASRMTAPQRHHPVVRVEVGLLGHLGEVKPLSLSLRAARLEACILAGRLDADPPLTGVGSKLSVKARRVCCIQAATWEPAWVAVGRSSEEQATSIIRPNENTSMALRPLACRNTQLPSLSAGLYGDLGPGSVA